MEVSKKSYRFQGLPEFFKGAQKDLCRRGNNGKRFNYKTFG
jgi:hypothetical protein